MAPNDNYTPLNIIEWEQNHGIFRRQVNGMTYIYAADYGKTCESIERENRQRYAREMAAQAHEKQAERRGE